MCLEIRPGHCSRSNHAYGARGVVVTTARKSSQSPHHPTPKPKSGMRSAETCQRASKSGLGTARAATVNVVLDEIYPRPPPQRPSPPHADRRPGRRTGRRPARGKEGGSLPPTTPWFARRRRGGEVRRWCGSSVSPTCDTQVLAINVITIKLFRMCMPISI